LNGPYYAKAPCYGNVARRSPTESELKTATMYYIEFELNCQKICLESQLAPIKSSLEIIAKTPVRAVILDANFIVLEDKEKEEVPKEH